jgi:hypothetical protein
MALKVTSIDGSNAQEITSGQLEIEASILQDGRMFRVVTNCFWNDRGVRSCILSDPLGIKITVIP